MDGSSPSNSSTPGSISSSAKAETVHIAQRLQHQTSTESLADLQPAAPEVVLPQQSLSVSPIMKEDKIPVALTSKISDTSNVNSVVESKCSTKPQEDSSLSFSATPTVPIIEEKEEENAGHKFLKVSYPNLI